MGNVMPQNIDAETNVLGAIINDGEKFNEIDNILSHNDFYTEKHKIIFDCMKNLNSKGINIDPITLSENLKSRGQLEKCGGITYITELSSTSGSWENIVNHANIVREKADRRRFIKAAMKMIESSYESELDEVADSMEKALDSVTDKNKDGDIISISDALQNAITNIESKFKNGGSILGNTTGFKKLDNYLSGLQRGDFIVIAARPSMGKTAFALNIAQATASSASVGIFSLEMPESQLVDRLLSAKCLIPLDRIKNGMLNAEQFENIAKGSAVLASKSIFIDDNSISLADIKARCRALKKRKGLDVVIIDYLQLLESSDKSYSREQEIAKISRELKKMAKKLDITVIALAQLSRAPEQRNDKRPMLSDLRESGSIEQDADIVMFLYRDEYYNPDTDEPGIAEVIISKNRNGEVGTVKLAWKGEYQRFGELVKR